MLTLMTDAYEGNDVATCDIAGDFLKGDMDDFVLVKLTMKKWTSCVMSIQFLKIMLSRKARIEFYICN